MLKTSLCSISFKEKTPEEIISLAKKAGISAIEWASDPHVPQGDTLLAKKVSDMTRAEGIEISSYGSYFRLGTGMDIVPFLESAKALGTDTIRIWAGTVPSLYLLPDARRVLVNEAKEISKRAADYGMILATECHAYTVTDTPESLLTFLDEVGEENFKTYWQALLHIPESEQFSALSNVYSSGKLTNLHIYYFNLYQNKREQILLREGYDFWLKNLTIFANDPTPRYAAIEFVQNGLPESLFADARTLTELTDIVNNKA